MEIICTLLVWYVWVIIARIILDWIQIPGDHPVAKVRRVLARVTDPLMVPIRRTVPPLRMERMALDLSPILLILAINILRWIIC